jgi:hypothetical protein
MADKRKAAAEAAAATAAKAEEKGETKADGPPAKILDSLEEDDEFEEFENQSTKAAGIEGGGGAVEGRAAKTYSVFLGPFLCQPHKQEGGGGGGGSRRRRGRGGGGRRGIFSCSLWVGRAAGGPYHPCGGMESRSHHCSIESARVQALHLPPHPIAKPHRVSRRSAASVIQSSPISACNARRVRIFHARHPLSP